MPYSGSMYEIRFGKFGLVYDPAEQDIPNGALIRADNTQFYNGIAEKAEQIQDWVASNPSYETPSFSGAEKPLSVKRYYPVPSIERHLCVTNIGKIYKYNSPLNIAQLTPQQNQTEDSPATLSVNGFPVIIEGGNEIQGNPKKIFILSGNSPVQVIYGDENEYKNISLPALDWANSAPTNGVIFGGRNCLFGNLSNPHQLYVSLATNHEDFQGTGAAFISVFPGEGDGLYGAFVFKSRLFLFKKPYGVYYIETQDSPDPTNWFAKKISSNVGIASPAAFFEGADDLFFMSTDGTIVSFTSALRLGDIFQGDVLASLGNQSIFRNVMRKQFLFNAFAQYLPQKKIGVFAFPSYKSVDGMCDCFVYIDFNQQTPRVSWHRYNNTAFSDCTFYKDQYGQDQFLFTKQNYINGTYDYGSLATTYPIWNGNLPFRIQTPHSNFGINANKNFDFFELVFESSSAWPLAVDVYIDSKFSETFLVQPYFGEVLGPNIFGSSTKKYSNPTFELDNSSVSGRGSRVKMHSLNGRGQTISFVIRDGNVLTPPYDGKPNKDDDSSSTYSYKITGIKVYYEVAGQDQKAQTK